MLDSRPGKSRRGQSSVRRDRSPIRRATLSGPRQSEANELVRDDDDDLTAQSETRRMSHRWSVPSRADLRHQRDTEICEPAVVDAMATSASTARSPDSPAEYRARRPSRTQPTAAPSGLAVNDPVDEGERFDSLSRGHRATVALARDDHRRAVAEQSLVGGDADGGALDLPAGGLTLQLPGELADLRDRLGGDGLAEAGQSARRVDRDPAADGGGAAAQQLLRPRPWRTGRGARTSPVRARSTGRRPRPG